LLKIMSDDMHLTRSRQGMGTMEYGAPEQFEDAKRVDRRCDLSLAATLYAVLTGKFPFGKGGHLQIMQRKLMNQFVPLRLLLPGLDPAVDRLVNQCLEPRPTKRPEDCNEFIDVLRTCHTGPTSGTDGSSDVDLPKFMPSARADRRATLRFAVDLTVTFVPFHQNMRGRQEATILEVSPGGVRLETPHSVAVNSVLQVTLGKRATSELVLVRWVESGTGDTQIAGCSFVRSLPSQEVEAICRAAAPKTAITVPGSRLQHL
jgi:serine/threonine protein kinase